MEKKLTVIDQEAHSERTDDLQIEYLFSDAETLSSFLFSCSFICLSTPASTRPDKIRTARPELVLHVRFSVAPNGGPL
jgi:hypothetical protein